MAVTKSKGPRGVADDVRKLRRSAGLTRQQLAQMADCSLAAVALYEGGYQPANSKVLPRIISTLAEALVNKEDRPTGNGTVSETAGAGVADHETG